MVWLMVIKTNTIRTLVEKDGTLLRLIAGSYKRILSEF